MSKVYDSLMKSGNFTAAQNKADTGEAFDSIGELVAMCETEGFIPRYYTDGPKDRVDETLQDLKNYTHTLVTEEMNLGNLIEGAIKKMQEEENKEEEPDMTAQMNKSMVWMMPILAVSVSLVAPLGLALYWLVNNILMIGERIVIDKFVMSKEEEENDK